MSMAAIDFIILIFCVKDKVTIINARKFNGIFNFRSISFRGSDNASEYSWSGKYFGFNC